MRIVINVAINTKQEWDDLVGWMDSVPLEYDVCAEPGEGPVGGFEEGLAHAETIRRINPQDARGIPMGVLKEKTECATCKVGFGERFARGEPIRFYLIEESGAVLCEVCADIADVTGVQIEV